MIDLAKCTGFAREPGFQTPVATLENPKRLMSINASTAKLVY